MKTLTICGSMKFCNVMKDIAYYLETEKGYNILQCVYCPNNINSDNDELKALEKAHYKKIDLSNGIYVVNIGGYIGKSVQCEIEYAKSNGKEIIYHCGEVLL